MSTLDSLVQEMILRNKAAGGTMTIASDASDNAKLDFIRNLMRTAD